MNAKKTKVIAFGNVDYTLRGDFKVKISGDDVEAAEEYKYLGCILNHRIFEISDMDRITKSFYILDESETSEYTLYVIFVTCKKGSSSKFHDLLVSHIMLWKES